MAPEAAATGVEAQGETAEVEEPTEAEERPVGATADHEAEMAPEAAPTATT